MNQDIKTLEFEYNINQEDGLKWSKISYIRSEGYKRCKKFLILYPIIFVIILIVCFTSQSSTGIIKPSLTIADIYDLAWSLLGLFAVYFMIAILPVIITPHLIEKNARKIYKKREDDNEILKYRISNQNVKIVAKNVNTEYNWEELNKIEYNEEVILLYNKVRVIDVIPLKTLSESDKELILNFAKAKLPNKSILKI